MDILFLEMNLATLILILVTWSLGGIILWSFTLGVLDDECEVSMPYGLAWLGIVLAPLTFLVLLVGFMLVYAIAIIEVLIEKSGSRRKQPRKARATS